MRTREDLFLNKDYKNLMKFLIKEDLKDNSILKWLKTIFYRKKGD
jgi:hypothetical protein